MSAVSFAARSAFQVAQVEVLEIGAVLLLAPQAARARAVPIRGAANAYLRCMVSPSYWFRCAPSPGFEPRLTDPESAVLPLHYDGRTRPVAAGRVLPLEVG